MEGRAAAIGMVYRHVLRLPQESLKHASTGKIISLMTGDAERFIDTWVIHALWGTPLMTIAAVVIGWHEIGPSMLAGVSVMALMLPLQLGFGKMFASARRETAKRSDARVNAVKDVIRGMRAVKMASWEEPLAESIGVRRAVELKQVTPPCLKTLPKVAI